MKSLFIARMHVVSHWRLIQDVDDRAIGDLFFVARVFVVLAFDFVLHDENSFIQRS